MHILIEHHVCYFNSLFIYEIFLLKHSFSKKKDMFTYNQVNSTRMWMPCIDNMNDRCIWEMEYTVSYENSVASTGDLICPPEIDDHSKTKRFFYQSDIPISAPNVFFAVGNFCIVPDPAFPEKITYFCLPGRDIFLPSTVGIMRNVCIFYIKFTITILKILYKKL